MKTGFGDPRLAPKFTFSNSSSGWIYASLFGSFKISSYAIMQSDGLGPSCTTHLGLVHLHKRYINLPLSSHTTMHSWDPEELVSFFYLFCPGGSLDHGYPLILLLLLLLRQVLLGSSV